MSRNARKNSELGKICAAQNANGASNKKYYKTMKDMLSGDNLTISSQKRIATHFYSTFKNV